MPRAEEALTPVSAAAVKPSGSKSRHAAPQGWLAPQQLPGFTEPCPFLSGHGQQAQEEGMVPRKEMGGPWAEGALSWVIVILSVLGSHRVLSNIIRWVN